MLPIATRVDDRLRASSAASCGAPVSAWMLRRPAWFFLFWAMWLSAEYVLLGPGSFVKVFDNGDGFLPIKLANYRNLHSLGYWHDYPTGGADALAGALFGDWIIDALFWLVPGWLAYGLITFVHRFVAGYFVFRIVTTLVGTPGTGALFAGLAFALFSHNWLNYAWEGFTLYIGVLAVVPVAIWFVSRLGRQRASRAMIGGFCLGVLVALTTHYYMAPFAVAGVLVWSALFTPRSASKWAAVGSFAVGCGLASAPALAAGFLNSAFSQRTSWTHLRNVDWSAVSIVNGVLANVLGVGLACIGFWASPQSRPVLAKLLAGGIGCLVVADASRLLLSLGLPGPFSTFGFTRMEMLAPLFLTIAAGVGVTACAAAPALRRLGAILPLAAIAVVVGQSITVKIGTAEAWYYGARYSLLYEHPDIRDLASRIHPDRPARVASVPLRLHPAFAWAYGLETVDGYLSLYPRRYQQFWEKVIEPITSKDPKRRTYFSEWGSRVYLFTPVDVDISVAPIRFDRYWHLPLLSLANMRYVISRTPLVDERLVLLPSRVPDLRTRWVDESKMRKLSGVFTGEYPSPFRLYVYENTQVFDRAFVVYRTRSFSSDADLLAGLGRATVAELRTTAFLRSGPIELEGRTDLSPDIARVSSRQGDRIVIDATLKERGVIVVTNVHSPYWYARLDGRPQPIVPVDHAFQGVFADAGSHRLELEYRPPYGLDFWPAN